jgi:hypothetical protein
MKTPTAPPLLVQNGTLILPNTLIEGGAILCEQGKNHRRSSWAC